jgi:hypothetical protein
MKLENKQQHYEEYILEIKNNNLHPKLEKIYNKFPEKIEYLKNIILYGPSGVGKYSQMLYLISRYSPSNLKYERKISILFNKKNYYIKISDIHYEINMSLLGCNSKALWHEIYQQIVDIILLKENKTGIIVCKDFQDINNELLENFYSYIQNINCKLINIIFIIITEHISFIPQNIINSCLILSIPRPTKKRYIKCFNLKNEFNKKKIENITSIKLITNEFYLNDKYNNISTPYKIICDKIINIILDINKLDFLKFRDILYDIFIYNLNITDCIWYILEKLIYINKINKENIKNIILKLYYFFKYYNNNYRPIYHLENLLFNIILIINNSL